MQTLKTLPSLTTDDYLTKREIEFKRNAIKYLKSQGYDLTWEQIITEYNEFWDNPQGPKQNEIDSILADDRKWVHDFIIDQITLLPEYNIS